jgi:hypothetical protein
VVLEGGEAITDLHATSKIYGTKKMKIKRTVKTTRESGEPLDASPFG